jgi:5'-deoxynucleotidase YfbR-like HD superfamily hydrolase
MTTHDMQKPTPRAWQRMLSGRRLDLLDPQPQDIEIADIAHGLARVARWNGQTIGTHAFSVAQHSLLVERIIVREVGETNPALSMAALLHDAPEYVIGDLISPFKSALGIDYKTFEWRLLAAIHRRFGLPDVLPAEWRALIKSADHAAAWWEATRLAGFTEAEAHLYFEQPANAASAIPAEVVEPWMTGDAQARFLARFAEVAD